MINMMKVMKASLTMFLPMRSLQGAWKGSRGAHLPHQDLCVILEDPGLLSIRPEFHQRANMGLCLGARPADLDAEKGKQALQQKQKPSSASSSSKSVASNASTTLLSPLSSVSATDLTETRRLHHHVESSDLRRSTGSLEDLKRTAEHSIKDKYTFGAKLGQGAVATVYDGFRKSDNLEVALKVMDKNNLFPEEVEHLQMEVGILRSLSHPNIVGFQDFGEDDTSYYVVMDVVKGGELRHRITAKTIYTEKEARDLFVTLVSAISYMHSQGVVHRDLKLENLLMAGDDDTAVKIADFGVAAKVEGDERPLQDLCGTPWYLAPEILNGEKYGKPVDMWAIGVIFFILLGGFPPFHDSDEAKLYEKIKACNYAFQPAIIWDLISEEAKDLLCGLLDISADKRLTADEALAHPWVRKPEHMLRESSLTNTQQELIHHPARLKFKAKVRMVIAANRIRLSHMARQKDEEEAGTTTTTGGDDGEVVVKGKVEETKEAEEVKEETPIEA